MNNSKVLVVGLICIAVLCSNAEAKLFKWVDKDGETHYGETIPPEYADRNSVEINQSGRIEKSRKVISPESRQASKEADAKKIAEEEALKESKRRDNALLNTYTTEKEIDLARNRSLQQVEARISSYSILLKSSQESLDGQYQEQSDFTKQGRKIPKSLTDDIDSGVARVGKYKKELAQSEQEKINVQNRYEADKARFRQLKGISN